jgi:hypothetical protein
MRNGIATTRDEASMRASLCSLANSPSSLLLLTLTSYGSLSFDNVAMWESHDTTFKWSDSAQAGGST